MNTHGKIQVQNGINKMINMTDEQVVEKLIGILQPIYQEGSSIIKYLINFIFG